MNVRCCCLMPKQFSSSMLQTPVRGNHLAIIAESPTEASKELGMVLAGETGLNICRIFEQLKSKDYGRYSQFCLRRALLVNVSSSKRNGRIENIGEETYRFVRKCIKRSSTILCVGAAARDMYKEINSDRKLHPKIVVELCHLSRRGLGCLARMQHPIDEKIKSRIDTSTSRQLKVIADWIDRCCNVEGHCCIGDFRVFGKIVHGDFFAWSPERLRMAG